MDVAGRRVGSGVIHPVLWTTLASWLLASWVCLFKRCESGRADAEELVRF